MKTYSESVISFYNDYFGKKIKSGDISNLKIDDIYKMSIDFAYGDFKRTLAGINKNNDNPREEAKQRIKDKLEELKKPKEQPIDSQESFDKWHKKTCKELIKLYGKVKIEQEDKEEDRLKFGQAQKWVNMTLKYLVTFLIANKENNAFPFVKDNWRFVVLMPYYHIPVDSYILAEAGNKIPEEKNNIKKLSPWSKMEDESSEKDYSYNSEYYKFQKAFREICDGRIPLEVEFELWESHKESVNEPESKSNRILDAIYEYCGDTPDNDRLNEAFERIKLAREGKRTTSEIIDILKNGLTNDNK